MSSFCSTGLLLSLLEAAHPEFSGIPSFKFSAERTIIQNKTKTLFAMITQDIPRRLIEREG
ncbi:hypothetical protein [Desulfatirhabdium butyrativorans]|uniref:hypothetical protein n=1 Tax=Desulfatirhabdium butyrativorans TaxID=340467 RepID=UPI0012EC09B8|nr:hypothetical protein [Desulfatirhabdium butyrativorans]